MIVTAKFASVCPCCNARIDVGSKVEWSKGAKARHVTCTCTCTGAATTAAPAPAPAPSTSSPRRSYTRRTRGARYCEGWGADNPHAPRPPYTCTWCADDC